MVLEIEFSSHTIPIPYHTKTVWYGMGNREISQTPLWYHVLLPITPKSISIPKFTKVQILFYILLIDFIYIYIYLYIYIFIYIYMWRAMRQLELSQGKNSGLYLSPPNTSCSRLPSRPSTVWASQQIGRAHV